MTTHDDEGAWAAMQAEAEAQAAMEAAANEAEHAAMMEEEAHIAKLYDELKKNNSRIREGIQDAGVHVCPDSVAIAVFAHGYRLGRAGK